MMAPISMVPVDLFCHAAQLAVLLEAGDHGAEVLARHRSPPFARVTRTNNSEFEPRAETHY